MLSDSVSPLRNVKPQDRIPLSPVNPPNTEPKPCSLPIRRITPTKRRALTFSSPEKPALESASFPKPKDCVKALDFNSNNSSQNLELSPSKRGKLSSDECASPAATNRVSAIFQTSKQQSVVQSPRSRTVRRLYADPATASPVKNG